jgi:zinc protease
MRTCEVSKQAGVSIVECAYHIPRARDDDFVAVSVLITILAGGFAARLQRSLVDTGLTADIHVMMMATYDPGLVSFIATLNTGTTHTQVREAIISELDSICVDSVTLAELRRAQTRMLSQVSYDQDGIYTETSGVSEAIAAGDWTLLYRTPTQISAVTRRDIQRVAQTYFTPHHMTYGKLINTL